MAARRLVLDANTLIRTVLAQRVKTVITTYAVEAEFFVPQVASDDASRHLPHILTKHNRADEVGAALAHLSPLRETVLPVPEEVYLDHKAEAARQADG